MNLFGDFQKIQIKGLVTQAEIKSLANGQLFKLSVLVKTSVKKDGQYQDVAKFWDVTVFDSKELSVELLAKHIAKGSGVQIWGDLKENEYTNKDGQLIKSMGITASSINISWKPKDGEQGVDVSKATTDVSVSLDDLPF